MKVGILALQGSFAEHAEVLRKLKQDFCLVRSKEDLKGLTHLIIPGGESTTLEKLLREYGMWEAIQLQITNDLPHEIVPTGSGLPQSGISRGKLRIMGTCAGAILCTKWGMDIDVERNGYGAQQESFTASLESQKFKNLTGVFIRAPKIIDVGKEGVVLAEFQNQPVMVEEKNFLVLTFHPELSEETRIHEYFLKS